MNNKVILKPQEIERLSKVSIDQAVDAICWIDSQGRIYRVNQSACNLLGYSSDELLKLTIPDIERAFPWKTFENFWNDIKSKGKFSFESIVARKDNSLFPAEITVYFCELEETSFVCSSFRDITLRKNTENKIKENENLLRAIFNHHFQLTFLLDTNGILLMANQTALNMLQLNHNDVINKNFWETPWWIHSEKEQIKLNKAIKHAAEGEFIRYETIHLDFEGQIHIIDFSLTPLFDDDGKVKYIIPEGRDTTQYVEAKEKLEEALKEVSDLKNKLEAENTYLQEEIKFDHNFGDMIGNSPKFIHVLKQIQQVADTDSNVLVLGETGTGKELIARAVHDLSNRKERPLVKINCAALPANLIESELFGHEKGAFTGAVSKKIGRFELADNGTIFLDEIGDLPLELQAKLLRVLQEGELERLGSIQTIKVDVRVIAATNRKLKKLVKEGVFREDLFYRLHVFPIESIPLRERKDDISLLVNHFIKNYNVKMGKNVNVIPKKVLDQLLNYDWPGNVRELENVIERAIIFSKGEKLLLGDWFCKDERNNLLSEKIPLREMEKQYIISILEETNWKIRGKGGAAEILDMKPTTLASRIIKLGIIKP